MQVVVWIIIILLVIFLIWLLRRWIKRLIFILILLALAFLIYGIFNPSGAARIWYNVRTFPQRVASWMGSAEEFLDYDSYKLNISSIGEKIGDEIGDKIDLKDNEIGSEDDEIEGDLELNDVELNGGGSEGMDDNVVDVMEEPEENISQSMDKRAVKAFSRSIKFVDFSQLIEKKVSEVDGPLVGYSKSDLLGVIGKYIEENLDDDTDILVTVEYENGVDKPQRVILETRPKTSGNKQSIYFSSRLLDNYSVESEGKNVGVNEASVGVIEKTNEKKSTRSVQKTASSKLTQKEQKEAEEIFSILF